MQPFYPRLYPKNRICIIRLSVLYVAIDFHDFWCDFIRGPLVLLGKLPPFAYTRNLIDFIVYSFQARLLDLGDLFNLFRH